MNLLVLQIQIFLMTYDVLLKIIMLIKKEKESSKRDYCDQARSNQMYLR